ncbi:hypothetical protein [Alteromonas sp. PRIM-21]|uniref:hypothetical protein n=1 Tax=Alteromonas sp. PRIM-21 TaxID=1454978 RepID=UPI0022B94BE5|nr:hypothetical protein [Alteromonas sp. PRIM-21]MCZ8531575.1 hypothetical protein [Alteromonas sp. PRIM-21]
MTSEDLDKILQVMEQCQPQGIGIINLAKKAEIEIHELRKCLPKHKDYFVFLPNEQKYAINNFGPFKGSRTNMVANYKNELKKQEVEWYWVYFLFFAGCFSCAMAVLSNAT